MKKTITLLLVALMLLCVLTGCVQNDLGVRLNADGTGSVAMTLGLEKDFYDQLVANGSDPFAGYTTTTYTVGDDTYVGYTEATEYESYEEIEKALLAMEYDTEMLGETDSEESESAETNQNEMVDRHIFNTVSIEKGGSIFCRAYTFQAIMNPQPNETGTGYSSNDIFKVTVTVEMPVEIKQAQGGTIDGNKVTFDIKDITEANELTVTAESFNIGAVVGIAVAIVAIILVVLLLMKRKK